MEASCSQLPLPVAIPAVPVAVGAVAAAGVQSQSAIAKERRASRKAAAACLARQRHKSFVNNLQDTGGDLRMRISSLRARRGRLQVLVVEHMLTLMGDQLPAERMAQVRAWVDGSALLSLPPAGAASGSAAPGCADADAGSEKNSLSGSQPTAETEPEPSEDHAAPHSTGAPSSADGSANADEQRSAEPSEPTLCLDEELSKQVFMEQAVSAVGAALAEEYSCDYDDDELEMMQGHELQQEYGEGLAALLQHLAHSRQPQIQAWFELKQEMEEDDDEEETWTNLDVTTRRLSNPLGPLACGR